MKITERSIGETLLSIFMNALIQKDAIWMSPMNENILFDVFYRLTCKAKRRLQIFR